MDQHDDFEPLNELERLIERAAKRLPGSGAELQEGLRTHDLYAATPEPMPHGALGAGDRVQLIMVDLPNNAGRATAIFSSIERLAATYPNAGYVGAPGRALLNMVRSNPIILNPGHPHMVAWPAEVVAQLAGKPN